MALAQQTQSQAPSWVKRYIVLETRKAEATFDRDTRGLWNGSTEYNRALDKYNRRLKELERMKRATR